MSAGAMKQVVEQTGARIDRMGRRRPRVLHLIASFDVGGTERQAAELLKRLDRERFVVRLAALRREGPLYPEVATYFDEVPEFRLTSFYNANAAKQLFRLRAFLLRERIDILHAHDFYAGILGGAAARLAGVRLLACQRHLRLSDRRFHEWGTRLIYKMASRLLVNSEAIRDHIRTGSGLDTGKIVVIRNGLIPTEATDGNPASELNRRSRRDALRRELGLDPDVKLVGMVARLQPVKGHRHFIEAAAKVARTVPEAHFVFVGDGALRSEIEEQAASLGLAGRAHLLGERSDAAQIPEAFDVAALSSLSEGLPNAVMEAMAAGTPVVATAVGGVTELIEDGVTGLLVPPADAEAMAERLIFALTYPAQRTAIGATGQRFIQERFGMSRMVNAVERLYEELMGEPVGVRVSGINDDEYQPHTIEKVARQELS